MPMSYTVIPVMKKEKESRANTKKRDREARVNF